MNLFSLIMVLSISPDLVEYRAENDAYCQNLYWQPNAEEKLEAAWCDIDVVAAQIFAVRTGDYE